jgi:KTSC domain-containing protein
MDFSNNIAFERVYYNNDLKILFVIFRNGHGTKYAHENVPINVYNDFKESEFSNRYYNKNIKDKYNRKIAFLTDEDHKHLSFYK